MKIAIIDVQLGNLHSLGRCIQDAGFLPEFYTEPPNWCPKKIILPGVSSFDAFMSRIQQSGWEDWLLTNIDSLDTLLGICVGMQVLFNNSEEGIKNGLGFINGEAKLASHLERLPNMGWRSLQSSSKLTQNCNLERGFYFLHSYECTVNDPEAEISYSNEIVATVIKNNVFGVQFHPEKSYQNGVQLIKNFAEVS